jgi:hypothetical protein
MDQTSYLLAFDLSRQDKQKSSDGSQILFCPIVIISRIEARYGFVRNADLSINQVPRHARLAVCEKLDVSAIWSDSYQLWRFVIAKLFGRFSATSGNPVIAGILVSVCCRAKQPHGWCHVWTVPFTQGCCQTDSNQSPFPANSVNLSGTELTGAARLIRTRLCKDSEAAPYVAQRPRHSARAAARLSLKLVRLERLRS